jgi:hypothetical protein
MTVSRWSVGSGMPDIDPDVAAIVLVFSREEVMQLRVGRSADDLLTLTDDPQLRERFTHSIFLTFDGFDDDPREVHQIPQCRLFLQALNAQFPYWLHFLAPVPDLWAFVVMCLLEPQHVTPVPSTKPGQVAWSCDIAAVQDVLLSMVPAVRSLHADMGMPQDEGEKILDASMAAVFEALAQ